jgi:hypothetical protein
MSAVPRLRLDDPAEACPLAAAEGVKSPAATETREKLATETRSLRDSSQIPGENLCDSVADFSRWLRGCLPVVSNGGTTWGGGII